MAEDKEQEQINIQSDTKQRKTERVMKLLSFIILIFGIIFLIIVAQSSDIAIGWIVLTFIILLIISLFFMFFTKLKEKIESWREKAEDKETTPKEAPPEKIKQKLKDEALKNTEYFNEVKEVLSNSTETINNNTIVTYKVKTLYYVDTGNGKKTNICYVIYNANYLETFSPTILFDPTREQLRKEINRKSKKPEDEPERETSSTYNPLTGAVTEHRRVGRPRKGEEKNKSKGDLE
ncbi:MAG: hypothetical protein ACOCRX_07665 [Candidatus Woesearchaeota archaeon]